MTPFAACASPCACGFSRIALKQGTNDRDRMQAAIIENATPIAMGMNRNRPSPGIKASGARTRNVHNVETSSGMATSLAPRNAASWALAPRPRCRCVFSRQMIALSTIGPIANVNPASVITLIVWPQASSATTAANTDNGIVKMAIAVMRIWPRNSMITSEHKTAPRAPSCTRAAIEARTKTDWSITTFSEMSDFVSFDCISLMALLRSFTTVSVLAPCCR